MKHEPPFAGYPALSDDLIVALIDLIGRDSFAADLADLLDRRMGYHGFHIFLYRDKLSPVVLASRPEPVSYQRGLSNYVTYTYVINPAYRAFQTGRAAGVYLISDFLDPADRGVIDRSGLHVHIENTEPIGYRTPGWPRNKAEVIVLVNLPNGAALDFSFLTPLASRQTQQCLAALRRLFPYLDSVIQRQFAVNPRSLDAESRELGLEDRFQDFGGDALTSREREIAQLILVGHGSKSISLNLGISLPTVKTHRRNIYNKLQISSQAELFSLFLLHLK